MASLTPLSRPTHNLVAIDQNPRDCLSDGFNYPTFHLLNKQARVFLSQPQRINSAYPHRLLAIANTKGWFAAVKTESNGTSIILATLHELRSSLRAAKETNEDLFVPCRTIRLPAEDVNVIVFGMRDARLLVGFTGGQLLVYDTAPLFSAGTNDVTPLNMSKTSSAPFLQILPNPGAEADLAHLVAVVRGDGVVQVLDMNKLQAQCGWAGEGDAAPVAISWAPKGKHLAVGLRVGDIITYALSNNAVPHKQIPPTSDGYLVSLDWIASPLVFKTTYCSKIPESSDATLHIVHADARTSSGFYYNLMHPFPAADRNNMHALVLSIPKWDEDAGTSPENTSGLVIVGDVSSVDLEVLAHKGTQWFQQSQENPLQLPLDKNMNDTTLISLDADLTDLEGGVPIMYAYLNDGTLQGWKLDHPKPYVAMNKAESALVSNGPVIAQETPAFAAAFSLPTASPPFGQTGGSSAFDQPSTSTFVQQQPPVSPFLQQASFGSDQKPSPFGQSNGSPFGNAPSGTPTTSAFGSFDSSNAFGQSSFGFGGASTNAQLSAPTPVTREASMSDETSTFGGLSLGGGQANSHQPKAGSGIFGSFTTPASATASTSVFGGIVRPAAGFGAFTDYQSQQSTTPANNDASKSAFSTSGSTSAAAPPAQPAFGQSGFSKPTFGQSAFGQPSFGQPSFGKPGFSSAATVGGGGFGAFASTVQSSFTTPPKSATPPATGVGFSAFASSSPTAFGAPTTTPASEPPKVSSFAAPSGAFGGGFGNAQTSSKPSASSASPPSSPEPMAVVKSSAPIDDDEMSPPGSPVKRGATPMSTTPMHPPPANAFSNLSAPVRPASGFGAFGGVSADSPFFKKAETTPTTPNALFGRQPASTTPANPPPVSTTPANPPPASTTPKFGATSMLSVKSAFAPVTTSTTPAKSPEGGAFRAFSGTSTGFTSFAGSGKSFTDLLKIKDDGTIAGEEREKEKDKLKTEPQPTEPPVIETPKKEEQQLVVPETPTESPPPTPASIPLPKIGKKAEMKKESPPRGKPISSEESFVEISKEEGQISDEEPAGNGAKGVKGEEENDDGYLSGSLGPSDSEGSIDGTEEEEELEEPAEETEIIDEPSRATSVDPTTVPLPMSRSPSAPPEVPSIQVTSYPEPTIKKSSPPEAEPCNMPSGTATKPSVSVFTKPTPSSTIPVNQPFNLGLGRPSTRPVRSSPLAGVPVTSEGTREKTTTELPMPKSVPSPKVPPAELPIAAESAEKTSPRPKTSLLPATSVPAKPTPPAPADLPFSFKKQEPAKPSGAQPGVSGDGRTGPFSKVTAQGGFSGSPSEPATPSAGAPLKLPFGLKAGTGATLSAGFFGAPPTRPMSSPTLTPSAPGPATTHRPASVPPSFVKPPLSTAATSVPGAPRVKGVLGGAPSVFGGPLGVAAGASVPSEVPLEEGMQKECALLYNTMNQELDELKQLAQEASRKRQELAKSRGGSQRKADLKDSSKWGLVDAKQLDQLLGQFEPDLLELKELRAELRQKVRQIESKMLKAGTRKEEIARFTKAQSDKEFSKMLKTRTLGPEHLETQTQLRRSIRTIRDRIEKLEVHLQSSKKKLAEVHSGKPHFRVPTLDNVNRTYRNIDVAIQYQTEEIAGLSERISKLKLSTTRKALPSQGDPPLPGSESRRPFDVTPHIAVTTAAALNAERSAQKLKKALLAARKEPLLNDKAAQAPPARKTFKTPPKIAVPPGDLGFKTPVSGPLFPTETTQTSVPDWSFPETNFSPSPSPPTTRRGAARTKMHATNVPLKKSTGPSQPQSAAFDWGPLPTFNEQPPLAGMELPIKLAPKNPPGFVPLTHFKK